MPHQLAADVDRHQRLAGQADDTVDDRRRRQVGAGQHSRRVLQREGGREDRQPAQHHALDVGQQIVAPVQQGLQGAMTRQHGATSAREQRKHLVEPRRESLQAEAVDAAGGQLDRQRHAIQLAAQMAHDGKVRFGQCEAVGVGAGAFDEQLDGGVRPALLDVGRVLRHRGLKRSEPVHPLALAFERFTARGQDLHVRRLAQHAFGQPRRGVDHVLAIVEDDQHPAPRQRLAKGGPGVGGAHRDLQRRGERHRHARRVGQRGQVDEPDAIGIAPELLFRHRERDRRLAHAAWPDDRYEPTRGQPLAERRRDRGAADRVVQARGQVVVAVCRRPRRRRGGDDRRARGLAGRVDHGDRHHEAVAASRHVGDVARAAHAVAQDLAQR